MSFINFYYFLFVFYSFYYFLFQFRLINLPLTHLISYFFSFSAFFSKLLFFCCSQFIMIYFIPPTIHLNPTIIILNLKFNFNFLHHTIIIIITTLKFINLHLQFLKLLIYFISLLPIHHYYFITNFHLIIIHLILLFTHNFPNQFSLSFNYYFIHLHYFLMNFNFIHSHFPYY